MSGPFDQPKCEHRGCRDMAVACTDDGDFLCEDHYEEWFENLTNPEIENHEDEGDDE